MAIYFVSTEPDFFHLDQVFKDRKVTWDGVRGGPAQINMKKIVKGDLVMGYHSSPDKCVYCVMEAKGSSYPDPTLKGKDSKFHVIDFLPKFKLPKPVPIADMRANPALKTMKFLIMPRISVTPVTPQEYSAILKMAGATDKKEKGKRKK